ncbi:asparagine synthetase B family protein [Streptomyces sp. NBC_00239]|uniref:asparagine synthetase B family protein n=1 Tax=Streptomyces sp. NBC_00239 TaxID=2903640 RepID=UPI002E2C412B|nr:asparagine synthase-related protein [Streptomyces sp. NBC_00239]
MCGVVGVSLAPAGSGAGSAPDARALARHAIGLMAHRGPDGHGVAGTASSAVAMCRLRVRSRPADGVPFTAGHDGVHLAYNGEVYAVGSGARDGATGAGGTTAVTAPRGGLDEAQAVAAYDTSALDGMYALVRRAADGSVEVCRDPLGIKPLYLRRTPEGVAVASEIPALLDLFGPARVRPAAVAQFVLLGRVVDGGTCYEDIEPVPPGARLLLKEGRCELLPGSGSWQADVAAAPAQTTPEAVRAAVSRAVDRLLVSDRPLGLALSGGLDSTVLALELADRGVTDLATVSVVPHGNGDGVRDVAELGLPGTAWRSWRHAWTGFGPADLLAGVRDAVAVLGEPSALTSVPMYAALARLARESGIVVLLLGEGADEVFGGYRSYLGLDGLASAEEFYLSPDRLALAGGLLGPEALAAAREALRAALPADRGRPPAEITREFEYEHSLEPLLRRADHLLMSRGIEGRTPFLHGGLPALGRSFPMSALVRGGQTKVPLRQAYADRLPRWSDEVKKPFRAPVEAWLTGPRRDAVLGELAARRDLFASAGLRSDGIDRLLGDVRAGRPGATGLVFPLLSLGAWLEQAGSAAANPPSARSESL